MPGDQQAGGGEESAGERPPKYASAIDGRLPAELLDRLAATLNARPEPAEADEGEAAG
ncbi:MAG: hypothetical protein HOY76_38485 [Streptomyces sp.]|nr:hypothetical protein [Streptomyces sp.]NUS10933.1 hypothetical protein [Streptomyces sp.]